jgi:hypothetical protein
MLLAHNAPGMKLPRSQACPSVANVHLRHSATTASLVISARPGKKHPRVRTTPLVFPAILVFTKTWPATPLVLNALRDTSKTKTTNLFVYLASPGKSAMPTEQPVQNVCRECTKINKEKLRVTIAVPANTWTVPRTVVPTVWIVYPVNTKTKKDKPLANNALQTNTPINPNKPYAKRVLRSMAQNKDPPLVPPFAQPVRQVDTCWTMFAPIARPVGPAFTEKVSAKNARKEHLSMNLCANRAVLACTAPQIWKQSIAPLKVLLVLHVRRARIPRPQVSSVWTIATNARLGKKTHTKVPLWVAIARSVISTPFQKQQGPLPAMLVSLAERQMLKVCVVPCVQKEQKKRGPAQTITPVSGVLLVFGPTPMPKIAPIVQKDFIPIKPNRTVVKFVKQVVTIRIRRVLVRWMCRVSNAWRAGTPRRKVSLVRTIATNARRERKTHTKVPLWVTIVQIVRPIQNQKSKAPLNAFLVVLVKNQRKTVLNAVHVMSVRQALVQMVRAINVKPVGSVPTAWIRPRVNIVQLVLVKMTKDKHRVWNAARVNSTMLLVRWNANCV